MDKALFSHAPQSDLSTVSNNEHEHYLAEIKRIRNEIAGFRPIEPTVQSTGGKKVPPKPGVKPAVNKPRTIPANKSTSSTFTKRQNYY